MAKNVDANKNSDGILIYIQKYPYITAFNKINVEVTQAFKTTRRITHFMKARFTLALRFLIMKDINTLHIMAEHSIT